MISMFRASYIASIWHLLYLYLYLYLFLRSQPLNIIGDILQQNNYFHLLSIRLKIIFKQVEFWFFFQFRNDNNSVRSSNARRKCMVSSRTGMGYSSEQIPKFTFHYREKKFRSATRLYTCQRKIFIWTRQDKIFSKKWFLTQL